MRNRIGLGLVLVVLMAIIGTLAFASPEPQGSSNDRPSAAKQGGALGFQVFNNETLLAEWTITCNDGRTRPCSGSQEYCLGACDGFCGGPCSCPSCEQLPQQS